MPNVKQTLIPISAARSGRKISGFKGVTIHETGNFSVGSNASNHSKYMNGAGNKQQVSYQYVVDDKEAYLLIPENEIAWHAGDGASGTGNTKTIAIEICVNPDGNFKEARKNAAELTASILKTHGMSSVIDGTKDKVNGNVFQHNTFSPWGKNCPQTIRNSGLWDSFLGEVTIFLQGGAVDTNPATPETIDAKPYRVRLSSEDAKSQLGAYNDLQNAINVTNSNPGYSVFDKSGTLIYKGAQTGTTAISVGDTVWIVATQYDTGQSIHTWVKNTTHKVAQIEGPKALIGYPDGIRSWVALSGLVKA